MQRNLGSDHYVIPGIGEVRWDCVYADGIYMQTNESDALTIYPPRNFFAVLPDGEGLRLRRNVVVNGDAPIASWAWLPRNTWSQPGGLHRGSLPRDKEWAIGSLLPPDEAAEAAGPFPVYERVWWAKGNRCVPEMITPWARGFTPWEVFGKSSDERTAQWDEGFAGQYNALWADFLRICEDGAGACDSTWLPGDIHPGQFNSIWHRSLGGHCRCSEREGTGNTHRVRPVFVSPELTLMLVPCVAVRLARMLVHMEPIERALFAGLLTRWFARNIHTHPLYIHFKQSGDALLLTPYLGALGHGDSSPVNTSGLKYTDMYPSGRTVGTGWSLHNDASMHIRTLASLLEAKFPVVLVRLIFAYTFIPIFDDDLASRTQIGFDPDLLNMFNGSVLLRRNTYTVPGLPVQLEPGKWSLEYPEDAPPTMQPPLLLF